MAKILYQARSAEGKLERGYIDAPTLEQARDQLEAQGLIELKFFNEPGVAALREDLAELPPAAAAQQAEFELRLLVAPGYQTFIRELLRRNRIPLVVAAALLLAGLWLGLAWMYLLAFSAIGLLLGWPVWQFRLAQQYDAMQRAFAFGEWSRSLQLLEAMKSRARNNLLMRSDFEFRQALIRIRTGQTDLARETETLHDLRLELDAHAPGIFDSRFASLCVAAGDPAAAVTAMQRSVAKCPGDASRLLDLANTEARYGSADQALTLLNELGEAVLPEFARPFVSWTRGLIALRAGLAEAEGLLAEAMQGFMGFALNPAVIGPMGLCGGAYAIALARNGQRGRAREVVRKVSPVLKAHGDKALLTLLRFEMKKAELAERADQP